MHSEEWILRLVKLMMGRPHSSHIQPAGKKIENDTFGVDLADFVVDAQSPRRTMVVLTVSPGWSVSHKKPKEWAYVSDMTFWD